MDERLNKVQAAIAAAVGVLTGLWGWLGWLVVIWAAAMALDYVTGSAVAGKTGEWSSAKARKGIWHKCGMLVVVIVAAGADLLISLVLDNLPVLALPVPYPGLVCPIVLIWYIITEAGSITENAMRMGAPVPGWLTRLLAAGREAVDKAGNTLSDKPPD